MNVEKLTKPDVLNPKSYHISREGRESFDIEAISVFRGKQESYWNICFKDGSEMDYHESDLHIAESCLNDKRSADVFQYIKQMTKLRDMKVVKTVSNIRNEETGEKLSPKRFDKITYVGNEIALAKYLNPSLLNVGR